MRAKQLKSSEGPSPRDIVRDPASHRKLKFKKESDFSDHAMYEIYVLSQLICGANSAIDPDDAYEILCDAFEFGPGLDPRDAYNVAAQAAMLGLQNISEELQ